MEKEKINICPNCGEKSNLYYKYSQVKIDTIDNILCNRCGANFLDVNDTRLLPYERLKSIFNEGELTQKGSANLDEILGIKKKEENKIMVFFKKFFTKIDSLIFRKPGKITNTPHRRLR